MSTKMQKLKQTKRLKALRRRIGCDYDRMMVRINEIRSKLSKHYALYRTPVLSNVFLLPYYTKVGKARPYLKEYMELSESVFFILGPSGKEYMMPMEALELETIEDIALKLIAYENSGKKDRNRAVKENMQMFRARTKTQVGNIAELMAEMKLGTPEESLQEAIEEVKELQETRDKRKVVTNAK